MIQKTQVDTVKAQGQINLFCPRDLHGTVIFKGCGLTMSHETQPNLIGSYNSIPSFEEIFFFTSKGSPTRSPPGRTQPPNQWRDQMDQLELKGVSVLVPIPAHPDLQGCWASHLPAAVFSDSDTFPTVWETCFHSPSTSNFSQDPPRTWLTCGGLNTSV